MDLLKKEKNTRVKNLSLEFRVLKYMGTEMLRQYYCDLVQLYITFPDSEIEKVRPESWRKYSVIEIIEQLDEYLDMRNESGDLDIDEYKSPPGLS